MLRRVAENVLDDPDRGLRNFDCLDDELFGATDLDYWQDGDMECETLPSEHNSDRIGSLRQRQGFFNPLDQRLG